VNVLSVIKKTAVLFAVTAAAMIFSTAGAEQARDIVRACKPSAVQNEDRVNVICDGDDDSMWSCTPGSYLQFTVPENETVYGVYVKWGMEILEWQIVRADDGAVMVQGGQNGFAHEYQACELETGIYRLKWTDPDCGVRLRIRELALYTEGDLPSSVQRWKTAPDKVDLLVIAAHPDDELLFFGGTLPYYAGVEGKEVLAAYITYSTYNRRTELLNGLWHCGVTNYPVMGEFNDVKFDTRPEAYREWGKQNTLDFFTELMRAYRPDVVVTHDTGGEYGHGAHMVAAEMSRIAITSTAADESIVTEHAPWQVKKLYLHMSETQNRKMDWSIPADAFNGKTPYEISAEAFDFHRSQVNSFNTHPDGAYSCRNFGLAFSAVGDDVLMDDFFENIP